MLLKDPHFELFCEKTKRAQEKMRGKTMDKIFFFENRL